MVDDKSHFYTNPENQRDLHKGYIKKTDITKKIII